MTKVNDFNIEQLVRALWKTRYHTILAMIGALAIGGLYILNAKPLFEVSVNLYPPSIKDIAKFNIGRNKESELEPYSVGEIFSVFNKNLNSRETEEVFFDAIYYPELKKESAGLSKDELFREMQKRIVVLAGDKNSPARIRLSFNDSSRLRAEALLNSYVDYVEKKSRSQISQDIAQEAKVIGDSISRRITAARESARIRREDRLAALVEALAISESIGLESAPIVNAQNKEQLNAVLSGNLMYMRGAKALRAEIATLSRRKSDDPFIYSLRNYQEDLSLYNNVNIDLEAVSTHSQDGEILNPENPIFPKKGLILSLCALLGLMLGCLYSIYVWFSKGEANGSSVC
jgi:chain length determinant protein (polysaccharide antigen chain regulator)